MYEPITDLMLHRMAKSFLILIGTDEFYELNIEDVCKYLSSDSLVVNSEIEVIYAALLWLIRDYEERECYVRRILQTIRFELMPSMLQLNFDDNTDYELMPDTADRMSYLFKQALIHIQERARFFLTLELPRNGDYL